MISTGAPAASLVATRGSDPTDLATPFDPRQGTRLKISVADFATSFTLSIALLVMLLCAAGADGSTAVTLPTAGGGRGLVGFAVWGSGCGLSWRGSRLGGFSFPTLRSP